MSIANKNYFEIFSLQQSFDLDMDKLTVEYKKLQALSHPDKFSDADDASRLEALQLSSFINDAYDVLKSPVKRAAYLLTLNGIDPEEHNQNHLSEALLLQQMDWREQLHSATQEENLNTIDQLKQDVSLENDNCIDEFRQKVNAGDFSAAKPVYNKLQFIQKMLAEINRSEEKILDY